MDEMTPLERIKADLAAEDLRREVLSSDPADATELSDEILDALDELGFRDVADDPMRTT